MALMHSTSKRCPGSQLRMDTLVLNLIIFLNTYQTDTVSFLAYFSFRFQKKLGLLCKVLLLSVPEVHISQSKSELKVLKPFHYRRENAIPNVLAF